MEHWALFRFFGELTSLAAPQKQGELRYDFSGAPAVKDAVEALGVPHTEVDVIIVQDQSVGFDYHLKSGDQVQVLPFRWPVAGKPVMRLIPAPPRSLRFILDVHLGRLARRLRLLGFDALYRNDFADAEIAGLAATEELIVLTRDRGLLKRKIIRHGCLLTAEKLDGQLRVLQKRYDLLDLCQPLGRCPSCNGLLGEVDKAAIADQLQPRTLRYYHAFRRCQDCGKIFWLGTQARIILDWIQTLQDRFAS